MSNEWDRVWTLARGIAGLANDGLDGPADDTIVRADAERIAAIAEEQGGVVERYQQGKGEDR